MSTINGTLYVQYLSCQTFTPPDSCITNASVLTDARISAEKLEHRFQPAYAQNGNSASAADRRVVHVVKGATATVNSFAAGSKTLCTVDATISVNLYKNGSSILSGAVVLDSGNTVYITEAGTVSSPTLVAGDVLEVGVTVSAGAGALGNGVFAVVQVDEKAN